MARAKAARTLRMEHSNKLAELKAELTRLEGQALTDRKRAEIEGEIKQSMSENRHDFTTRIRRHEEASVADLAKVTPRAVQRRAIRQRPGALDSYIRDLAHLADDELAAFGQEARAEGDVLALKALAVVHGQRPKMAKSNAEPLVEALAPLGGDTLMQHIAELAVIRSELAAVALEYSHSGAATEREVSQALGLAYSAASIEVDGEVRRLDDEAMAAMHERVGVEKVTVLSADPEPRMGTFVPWVPQGRADAA